jgi:hypothetical protein
MSHEVEEETGVMNCVICGRQTDERYCPLHDRAHMNLVQGYEVWKQALGVNWLEYLKRVAANQNTGKWVVEVCQDLLIQRGKTLKE